MGAQMLGQHLPFGHLQLRQDDRRLRPRSLEDRTGVHLNVLEPEPVWPFRNRAACRPERLGLARRRRRRLSDAYVIS